MVAQNPLCQPGSADFGTQPKRLMEDGVRGLRNILFAILFSVASVGISAASDIYIAQNAAGGNTGADCADAHAATWFNTQANWGGGSGQIGPGTTVHLCGTVSSSLAAKGSGTNGNPITILFESGGKISMPACGATGCLNLAGQSYIVVDGGSNGIIEATNNGTGLGTSESIGVYARSHVANCEVKNLAISNMYVHSGSGNDVNSNFDYYAIWFDGTNSLFHDNVIHDAGAGIVAESPNSGNKFYNNTIYNSNWGIFLSGPGANAPNSITNDQVYNNDVHDFANWDTTSNSYHHDGIFVSGNDANAVGVSHVDIYNNYVHGSISNCSVNCMTAFIYVNDVNNVRLFNNLVVASNGGFVNNGLITLGSVGYPDANDALFNNTVVGGTSTGTGGCVRILDETNLSLENNVISNCGVNLWIDSASTFTTLDYNVYQGASQGGSWRVDGDYISSLAAWRSASHGDAHGQTTAGSLNLDQNYKPLENSMVYRAGTYLDNLNVAPLNSDKAGVLRPNPSSSTPWDVGAYQAASSNSTLNAPSGLSALVQ